MNRTALRATIISFAVFMWLASAYSIFKLNPGAQIVKSNVSDIDQTRAAQVKIIKKAEFITLDGVYGGQGTAIVFEQEGTKFIRFENFKVTSGTDLQVYLTRNGNITSNKKLGDSVPLGPLKSNTGSQTYEIPNNDDNYLAVIVWSPKFNTLHTIARFN